MKRMDHNAYPARLRTVDAAALHYIIKDAGEAAKAAQAMGSDNEGFYLDEVLYAGMELVRRRNA